MSSPQPSAHEAAAVGRSAVVAICDMDDETLESAAVLAALTHHATGNREAWTRLININAERRKRRAA